MSSLAEVFSARFTGEGDVQISAVADLELATSHCIAFYADKKYQSQLRGTKAAAVILKEDDLAQCHRPALITDNPYALFAEIAGLLNPDEDLACEAGVHVSASVHNSVQLGEESIVAANSVIEEGCKIGDRVYIGPGCVLKQRVRVGSDSKLVANVTICRDCTLGERVIVHPSAVIGSDGFGLARKSTKAYQAGNKANKPISSLTPELISLIFVLR